MVQFQKQTKKGVASLYAVIFATLLFGVITVGFLRLVLSESTRTINDDLSQSAYDAALAGIEDAKAAILRGGTANVATNEVCNSVVGHPEEEVKLGSHTSGDYTIEQAYTCVLVYTTLDSYNTTLNSENRARIAKAPSGTSSIRVSWYSQQNSGDNGNIIRLMKDSSGPSFQPKSTNKFIPPVTSVTLVPADGDDVAIVVLRPASQGSTETTVDDGVVSSALNKSDSDQNNPVDISCDINTGNPYACSVTIPAIDDLGYVMIDMPYGEEETDYRIEFLNSADSNITLEKQQVKIDSTGRANDLFRRIEAYIDFSDQNFPYPEYGVFIGGSNNSGINKNFWVTRNNGGDWKGANHGIVGSESGQ